MYSAWHLVWCEPLWQPAGGGAQVLWGQVGRRSWLRPRGVECDNGKPGGYWPLATLAGVPILLLPTTDTGVQGKGRRLASPLGTRNSPLQLRQTHAPSALSRPLKTKLPERESSPEVCLRKCKQMCMCSTFHRTWHCNPRKPRTPCKVCKDTNALPSLIPHLMRSWTCTWSASSPLFPAHDSNQTAINTI